MILDPYRFYPVGSKITFLVVISLTAEMLKYLGLFFPIGRRIDVIINFERLMQGG